jgi:rod shape-determining protein MreC
VRESKWTRTVLVVLVIAAVLLVTVDYRGGNSGAQGVGGRVFGPVERLAGNVTGFFRGSGNASEVANLQKQNDSLRAELTQAQTNGADTAQLAKLLRLTKDRYRVVAGTVVAAGGNYSDTVTVDAGTADGIAVNETVLNGDGLVGTVVSVSRTTATVQLLTDANTTVGVRLAGQDQIGSLTGIAESLSGATPLKLTLFNTQATLKPGQVLDTFGSVGGRPYVPGVPVGTVTKVTTQPGSLTPTALVKPFADFTGLGVIAVVVSR